MIERWFEWYLKLLAGVRIGRSCPPILGIHEHFFTRRHGYATTFCDLKIHKVQDVVLGRREASLEGYLAHLENKHRVQVVCMDLAASYRALVEKHFPRARIVADRFHVIPTVNDHFLACWKDIRPDRSEEPGLAPSWADTIASRHTAAGTTVGVSPRQAGAGGDLLLQTTALLFVAGKGPEPETLPEAGPAFSAGRRLAPWLRAPAIGSARP